MKEQINQLFANNNPIAIDEFMGLMVPIYYNNKDPFGAKGDFITAPEISQMFGEGIGVWCAKHFMESLCIAPPYIEEPPISASSIGEPSIVSPTKFTKFNLVELGPGRGTMMSDILRATKNVTGFHESIEDIYLVEKSSTLKEEQKKNLSTYLKKLQWVENIDLIPLDLPCIILANEFYDALPIKQYKKIGEEFFEIKIINQYNELAFIVSNKAEAISLNNRECPENGIIETSPSSEYVSGQIMNLLKTQGSAALIIDYGYNKPIYQSTLQAVKNHKYHNVFSDLGNADITAHVNFQELQNLFISNGFNTNLSTQSEFLTKFNIMLRANILIKNGADPQKIKSQLNRLLSEKEMGDLFKVLEVYSVSLVIPESLVT